MTSKVQGIARPNQIVVGHDVYERLHPTIQKSFKEMTKELSGWNFTSKFGKKINSVYSK
ncbi:MAG: hypothetical protein P8X83_03970 [Nitrosopumilaceae archaeon]|jgi:adenylate cyclase